MATTIELKNSVTTGNSPSSLAQGETGWNITDKKVWIGNASSTPIQLIGAGASMTLNSLTATNGLSVGGVSLGAGDASMLKNRIINGAMVIDQRNNGASVTPTTDGQYTLDRFKARLSQSSKFSVQQNAGSIALPTGFSNYLGVTSLSAYSVGASDFFAIQQNIEGFNIADLSWGTANAKTVTLSFQVYSSLTGTFGGTLFNNGNTQNYQFSYSIPTANTWTTISITIAGDTTGTWLNNSNNGIQVAFSLGCGSTYTGGGASWGSSFYFQPSGSTSVVGTSGATFYITGVQLEVGSSATGFEYRQYQQELALCQRYARGIPNGASLPTVAIGSTGLYSDVNTVVLGMNGIDILNMRTTPTTVTTVGTQGTDWAFQTSGGGNQTGFTLTTQNGVMVGTKTLHGITNNAINLRVLTTSGNIIISAEL